MASQPPNHKDTPERPNPSRPPIAGLPSELLSLVVLFSLPMVDPKQEQWYHGECRSYIAVLYSLRCISTRWRDVIDTNPSMWTLICFSWPREVIKTALARSSTAPIIIHLSCGDIPGSDDSTLLLKTRTYQETLGSFTRLKSLVLDDLGRRCLTINQIIQTISDNPSLEGLSLFRFYATVDSTLTKSKTALVAPPKLRIFRVETSVACLYDLMTRLELPLSMEEVVIIASATESSWQLRESSVSSWIHAMQPLSSIVQRLHSEHDGSTIFLEDGGRCSWTTNGGIGGFEFQVGGLNHRLGLECIGSLANELDCASGLPDLQLVSDSAFSAADSTLVALNRVKTLASIEIRIGRKHTHIDQLVEFISRMLDNAQDDRIDFPSLHTLSVCGRESDLDEIADKLQQRYSDDPPRPPYQLVLDVTFWD